jgi:hypothetical protein
MKKYHGSIDGIGLRAKENEKSQKNENKNVGFS